MNLGSRLDVYLGMRHAWRVALRVAGAGLLAATGAIHLDLYLTGYRTIPTIGALFLLQVIACFALALAVLVIVPARGLRLAAIAGALFSLATLGGYLLSIWVGLFGFREVRTTAGIVAGLIEVAAFGVLAALALTGTRVVGRLSGPARGAGPAIGGVSVLAVVLLFIAVAGASSPSAPGARAELRTARVGGATILTNSKGFTLYSFGPDSLSQSRCYGTCAAYWPPVTGTPVPGPGVSGKVATIRRAGGGTQVTYDGHPLYTYAGDSAPGQENGNNLNLNGGLWRVVPAAG